MKKRPYNFFVKAQAEGPALISIRGYIGEYFDDTTWTVKDTEEDVLNELNKIPAGTKIHVHINSPGGEIGIALGIHNAFASRAADITFFNDGYMCSAATILPPKGSRIVSPKSSVWMIHRASGAIYGNAEQVQGYVQCLQVHDDAMCGIYLERTGKSREDIRALMKAETWFTGDQAVEMGFATESPDTELPDEDDSKEAVTNEAARKLIASFKNAPENLRARFVVKTTPAQAAPAATNNPTPTKVKSMKLIIAALVAAGFRVATDATEEQIVTGFNDGFTPIKSERDSLKTDNDRHVVALRTRVTNKVQKAIDDKLIKAERKDTLIKAGIADETTLDFIDDIRADAATHNPRGVRPAKRGEGEAGNGEADVEALQEQMNGNVTAEERGSLAVQSLKARGLDGLFKKQSAGRQN